MKEIKHLLPKTNYKYGSNCCYTNLSLPRWNEKVERIELDYQIEFMDNPDKLNTLTNSFEKFYNEKINSKDRRFYHRTNQGDEEIIFNSMEKNYLLMGIDTNKEYIYFNYRKKDQQSRELVADFVFKLINN